MILYWLIVVIKKIVWFFRIPKPEDLARVDENARCPNCGWRKGKLRCVLKAKPGPRSRDVLPEGVILCQHTCDICGASWFDKPIAKNVTPATVLPSVARTELEVKQDRRALQAEETDTSAR
jgi:hypothetical protein